MSNIKLTEITARKVLDFIDQNELWGIGDSEEEIQISVKEWMKAFDGTHSIAQGIKILKSFGWEFLLRGSIKNLKTALASLQKQTPKRADAQE
jgi:hypothetical protein